MFSLKNFPGSYGAVSGTSPRFMAKSHHLVLNDDARYIPWLAL
jgi:hypothetical protein